MEWSEVSWVMRGRLKRRLLPALTKPKTATILAKEIRSHRSTISDVLAQMLDREIVKCLDPDQPYNRHYRLTKKGRQILGEVKKLNQ